MTWATGYKNCSFLPDTRQVKLSLQVSLSIYFPYLLIYIHINRCQNWKTPHINCSIPSHYMKRKLRPRKVKRGTITKITMQIGEVDRNPFTGFQTQWVFFTLYDTALTLSPIQSPPNRCHGHSMVSNINKKCSRTSGCLQMVAREPWWRRGSWRTATARWRHPPKAPANPTKGGEVHFYT